MQCYLFDSHKTINNRFQTCQISFLWDFQGYHNQLYFQTHVSNGSFQRPESLTGKELNRHSWLNRELTKGAAISQYHYSVPKVIGAFEENLQ